MASSISPIPTKLIRVSHLNTEASYHLAKPLSNMKPTVILINSFLSNATLFRPQLTDKTLVDNMNLIAIEPLGHGKSRCASPTFTYWDMAIVNLQVMEALGVKKAFVMGISQGGYIGARMALYAPDKIAGLIPVNASMDIFNSRLASHNCVDVSSSLTPLLDHTATPNASYTLPDTFAADYLPLSFGSGMTDETREFWTGHLNKTYSGDIGRARIREATINLLTRDTLVPRLGAIKCPVLWLVGGEEKLFNAANTEDECKMLTGSSDAHMKVIEGGPHLMSWTHATAVNEAVATFVTKHGGKVDARALREAVGMVEM